MRKYPYRIHSDKNGFYFFTKSKIKYQIIFYTPNTFWESYSEIKNITRDFSFYPIISSEMAITYDEKVSITIAHIFKRFFKKNPQGILTYVCDSSDSKALYRYKLFERWFNQYNKKEN